METLENHNYVFIVIWSEQNRHYHKNFKTEQTATEFMNAQKNIKFQLYKVKAIKTYEYNYGVEAK